RTAQGDPARRHRGPRASRDPDPRGFRGEERPDLQARGHHGARHRGGRPGRRLDRGDPSMIGARKDLLGLEDLTADEIVTILDTARTFREVLDRPIPKVPSLRGMTAANLFFEASTRTRLSFELAEKRLSADTVNFQASGSSVSKGETLRDTARNIEAMGIHLVVIRHQASGAPHYLARHLDAGVINAGDGTHEHPTQGLLDIYTMREQRGRIAGL